jgi:hypothetical protein
LFGVTPTDPSVFVGAASVLTLAAVQPLAAGASRIARRSACSRFGTEEVGEPNFHELQPDGGLAAADRGASSRRLSPRDRAGIVS